MPQSVLDCISRAPVRAAYLFQRASRTFAARSLVAASLVTAMSPSAFSQRSPYGTVTRVTPGTLLHHRSGSGTITPVGPGTTVGDILKRKHLRHLGGPRSALEADPFGLEKLLDSHPQSFDPPGNYEYGVGSVFSCGYQGYCNDYVEGFTNQANPVPMYAVCSLYNSQGQLTAYYGDTVTGVNFPTNNGQTPPQGMTFPGSIPTSLGGIGNRALYDGSFTTGSPIVGTWGIQGYGNPSGYCRRGYSGWVSLWIVTKDNTPTITATHPEIDKIQTVVDDPGNGIMPDTIVSDTEPMGLNHCSIVVQGKKGPQTINYRSCPIPKINPQQSTQLTSTFTLKPPKEPPNSAPGAMGMWTWANTSIQTEIVNWPLLSGNVALLPVPSALTTCYDTALESDSGTPPSGCNQATIYDQLYSGTIPGAHTPSDLQLWKGMPSGTMCALAVEQIRLQGTMKLDLHSGQLVHWQGGGRVKTVSKVTGSDNRELKPLFSMAADRQALFEPTKPPAQPYSLKLSLSGKAQPDDSGGRIKGYHLDMYTGIGVSTCDGWQYRSQQQIIASDPAGLNNSVPEKDNTTGVMKGTKFPPNEVKPMTIFGGNALRPIERQLQRIQLDQLFGPIQN